jgi:hypothetical protein
VSQWNLSVRLTGQGSNLSSMLRSTAGDARTASRAVNTLRSDIRRLRAEASRPIRLRLAVDGTHLRRDVQRAVSGAGRQAITIPLGVDGTRLRAQVRNALRTASAGSGIQIPLRVDANGLRAEVRRALSGASGQALSVDLRLGDAMQLRRDVQAAVRWAAQGHRITIPIGLADPMQLRRDVAAAVRWASMNHTIRIPVVPDTSALRNIPTPSLSGGSGGGGANFGLAGFIPFATAAIPLAAGLASTLAPVAGMFTAAAGGAAAFGIALAGQIGPLSEAAEAEKAYQDAIAEHGRSSTEAAEASLAYQRKLSALPPETQKAAVALSTLKTEFGDWSDEMSDFTMEPVAKGFTIMQKLLPSLSPEVESFSGQLDRLMNVAGGAISTPGFDAFSGKVADLTDQKLDSFTDQVIHLLRVASEGDAGGGALGQILDYVRQNGPAARDALDAVGQAVGVVAEGAADAGPGMLTLVTAVARLAGALPPELVGLLIQIAAGIKLVQLAAAGSAAAAGALTRVSLAIQTMGARAVGAGGGLRGVGAAIGGLSSGAKAGLAAAGIIAIGLALHELSDQKPVIAVNALSTSLNTLVSTGKVTGALKTNMDEMSESIAMVSKTASDNKLLKLTSDFGSWIGIADGPGISDAIKNVEAWDQVMADNVRNGHPKEAAAQFDLLRRAWKAGGGDMGQFKQHTDGYRNALADMKFEQDATKESMGTFGQAALDAGTKLAAQKADADALRQSLIALNETNRAAHDAETQFEASLDALSESFKKNGATLNAHTEAGRANRTAMSAAAKSQDELIASGLAAGNSFDSMVGKSESLRTSMMKLATDAFDGNTAKARTYVNTLLGTPKEVKTLIKVERENAISGLQEVRSAIQATPGAKSVKVSTLNAAAIAALEKVGYKTRTLPNGQTEVYTANGQAIGSIGAVSTALNNLNGKTANTYTVHTTVYKIKGRPGGPPSGSYMGSTAGRSADGNLYGPARVQRFAEGGMGEQHVAQIAQPTYRMWAEPETGGEAYIPFAPSKRPRSRAIAEETVRRLGGDPQTIQWNAEGSVTDWRYDPQSGSLYSPSDAGSAGNKTRKVKTKVKGKWVTKEVEYFDIGAVEKKLKSAAKATQAWNKDLERVADRVGGDVAEALASMGKEGQKLADKMANGSTKYINQMAKALRDLQKTAKASLTDYTRQLGSANKLNKEFSDDLATLAARGYGDLAKQLAAQNDKAAQELAAAAVKDKGKASAANKAAKTANNALTSDQVEQLVSIIAAITKPTTGIHDVAASTGLGEDEIVATATKASSQIKNALGSRSSRFLADLAKAQKGLAFANGGIRPGIYSTANGAVTFAEPSTGGEAYIPLGQDKRRHAMPVLSDVAGRFGMGLRDASEGRVIIIRQPGPLVGNQTWHVTSGGSAADTARQIDADNGYQLRRLARGGVGARG